MAIIDVSALTRLNNEVSVNPIATDRFGKSIIPYIHQYNTANVNAETTLDQDCNYLMCELMPHIAGPLCEAYMTYSKIPTTLDINPGKWFSREYSISLILSETGEFFSKAPPTSAIRWGGVNSAAIITSNQPSKHQNYVVVKSLSGRTDFVDIGLYINHTGKHIVKHDYLLRPGVEIEAEFNMNVNAFSSDERLVAGLLRFLVGDPSDMVLM